MPIGYIKKRRALTDATFTHSADCFYSVKPATAENVKPMMDEIVVTVSRLGQKLSDTTVTMSVIDEKEIEKVKYMNPDEILRCSSGFYTQDFSGVSELSSIRIPAHFTNPYNLLLLDGVLSSSYVSAS